MRYIVFDVETPNYRNDRMSALGVTVVENGAITGDYAFLINPQCGFNYFNIQLTGITPQMVRDKPCFPELWPRLEPIFDSGVLVAHNAPFDMRVLAACLRDYGISWKPQVPYACTCRMSRKLLPDLPNHRLNTICGYLGIALEHHNAASDSHACAELLRRCLSAGMEVNSFIKTYTLSFIDRPSAEHMY